MVWYPTGQILNAYGGVMCVRIAILPLRLLEFPGLLLVITQRPCRQCADNVACSRTPTLILKRTQSSQHKQRCSRRGREVLVRSHCRNSGLAGEIHFGGVCKCVRIKGASHVGTSVENMRLFVGNNACMHVEVFA